MIMFSATTCRNAPSAPSQHRSVASVFMQSLPALILLLSPLTTSAEEPRQKAKNPPLSPEREAAAIELVREQQPELARLLDYLRRKQPRQYQRAIRELARTAERLGQAKARDAHRYELELQAWKNRSRIDLLAAKWQVQPDDQLRERLRAAIAEQMALQQQLLEGERDRLAQRLKTVDTQLRTLESRGDAEIDRRMRALTEGRKKPQVGPTDQTEKKKDKDKEEAQETRPDKQYER